MARHTKPPSKDHPRREEEEEEEEEEELDSEFDTIPNEILTEILLLLPVESLLRLKSLNKSWYFLIKLLFEDPGFVTTHFRNSEAEPDSDELLLIPDRKASSDESNAGGDHFLTSVQVIQIFDNGGSSSSSDDDDNSFGYATQDLGLPSHLNQGTGDLESGHCNGVVCSSYDMQTFTLYNPALPECEMLCPTSNSNDEAKVVGMGFGCDSKGADYKIVRFFESTEAEIFTLGVDTSTNSWRTIGLNSKGQKLKSVDYNVYVKGKCFWLMGWEDERSSIVCLDMGSEEFRVIHSPVDVFGADWYLGRYKDRLCATENHLDSFDIDVWVLSSADDGGRSYGWTYFLKIEQVPRLYLHVGFWKSSLVLVDFEQLGITIYNPVSRKFKPLGDARVGVSDVICADPYVKSLVSVKRISQPRMTV